METRDAVERLLGDHGHLAVIREVAHHQQQEGLLGTGALEDFGEELHRGEGGQTVVMQGRNEKTGRDPHGLLRVVGFHGLAIIVAHLVLLKDDDEGGRGFEKRFLIIRAQVGQSIEPLLGRAPTIELTFLGFRRFADAGLHFGIADHGKKPPFSPIRSGPKAASKPSRQKQIPSSSGYFIVKITSILQSES